MSRDWWLWLIPFTLGWVFVLVGVMMVRRTRALRVSGASAYGQVVGHRTSAGRGGTLYHPLVRWTTEDGTSVQAYTVIGTSWIGDLRPGTEVLVYYDPHKPERMVIDGHGTSIEWVFCGIGAIAVTAAVVLAALTA